ncbi:MAG: hypothetical protein JXA72_12200 [Bacteroidales bacterium]|nr:hypothetical protein [Bacteroidales bacterium]
MKPKPELIEAVILVYTGSEIKNVIIRHEKYAGTDFESSGEYRVFNKTLKEKDILKFCRTTEMHQETVKLLKEFNWPEIRFVFLQYQTDKDTNIKLKLRPMTDSGLGATTEWQAYGRSIPFFTFSAGADQEAFINTFEKQLVRFLG